MLKNILHYSCKFQYSKLLVNTARKSSYNIQICYLSNCSVKPFYYSNSNLQLMSSVLYCIFNQINFRNLCAATSNEIESLRQFILSEGGKECEDGQDGELTKILTFLLSKGYSSHVIKEKCLPYLKSHGFSYAKFKQLEYIDKDILLLLPLLSLPFTLLRLAAKQAKNDESHIKGFPNRIAYLSCHLELKPTELIPAVAKHTALLTMKFKRLHYKMNILKSANINSEYIVKDLWIFNYNERLLASRVQIALKNGVEMKPWMLRCSEKFFESMLTKHTETLRILDGENVVDYLAKMLDCTTEYVEYMMDRNKLLKAINIPKIEQVLHFLFEKGYTTQEIRLFPRVFCSSIQTLSKRFEEYRQVKSTLPTIPQLCISSKNFKIALERKGL